MAYSDDIDLAQNYSARALDLMGEHQVPPHPNNYEVWYYYAAQRHPGLMKQIDEHVAAELVFDAEFNTELYTTHILAESTSEEAIDFSTRLSSEVDKILKLVDSAADNSVELGGAVRSVCDRLSSNSSPADVFTAVEAIVTATRHMEVRSQELESTLQTTRGELNELRENFEVVKTESRTDGLTGIANRKAFDEILLGEIRQAMEDGTSLSLLMCDIDHFKQFNDTWGHRVGDQVLRLAALCIRSNIKGRDTAARYGGEEFAVILPDTDLEGSAMLGEQIREAVQARELVKKTTGENLGRITMSLGLAEFRAGEPISELIERADACLYAAKAAGRNKLIAENDSSMKSHAASA